MAHLPPLISQQEYQDRSGRTLVGAEPAQFAAFAQDASAKIRRVAEDDFVDSGGALDLPDDMLPIVFRVVDRAMENRLGLSSETTGNYTWRKDVPAARSGVYLTEEDEDEIREVAGTASFKAVTLISPYSGTATESLLGS